jgi:hypothetical protein
VRKEVRGGVRRKEEGREKGRVEDREGGEKHTNPICLGRHRKCRAEKGTRACETRF